jgi:hypothetical protein
MDGEAELRCAMTASPHFVDFRNQPVWSNLELFGPAGTYPYSRIANDGGYRRPVRFMGGPLQPTSGREEVSRWTNYEPGGPLPTAGRRPQKRHIVVFRRIETPREHRGFSGR